MGKDTQQGGITDQQQRKEVTSQLAKYVRLCREIDEERRTLKDMISAKRENIRKLEDDLRQADAELNASAVQLELF
jgi:septal ring factor EnvC (AmiA/AmiB activator)